jgi:hypothetical protein
VHKQSEREIRTLESKLKETNIELESLKLVAPLAEERKKELDEKMDMIQRLEQEIKLIKGQMITSSPVFMYLTQRYAAKVSLFKLNEFVFSQAAIDGQADVSISVTMGGTTQKTRAEKIAKCNFSQTFYFLLDKPLDKLNVRVHLLQRDKEPELIADADIPVSPTSYEASLVEEKKTLPLFKDKPGNVVASLAYKIVPQAVFWWSAGFGDFVPRLINLSSTDPNQEVVPGAGTTLLMDAAANDRLEVVRALVTAGAAVNRRHPSTSQTALIVAASAGTARVVKYLLEKNAEIDSMDESKRTALMYACKNGHVEVIKLLLGKGAPSQCSGPRRIFASAIRLLVRMRARC